MNPLLSSMLEKTRARLLDWLLPTIGTTLAGIALASEEHLAKLVPSQPELWAVRAIALSLVLFGLLLGSFFHYRPKLKPVDWGAHQDTKTGAYFCSKCFIEHKRLSPLYLSKDKSQYKCSICPGYRHNPAYIPPQASRPPQPSGPHAWMSR